MLHDQCQPYQLRVVNGVEKGSGGKGRQTEGLWEMGEGYF